MKKFVLLSASCLLNFSCADWEQPTAIISSGGIKTERVILIDEFTGASCPNCPAGSVELEQILETYPDNVVVIGVHSRFLAEPVRSTDADLRTTDAENLEKFLGNYLGKPEAAFNRRLLPGKANIRIGRPDTWINFVDEELKRPVEARLRLETDFDENSRELSIVITATALKDISSPVYLHVALTESGIRTAQKNSTGVIDDYEHKHVLRKLVTPVEGEYLDMSMKKNSVLTHKFTFTLPATTDKGLWNADSMRVVAFISMDPANKTVLQATEKPVR